MVETDEGVGDFDFDPDQLAELGELSEAFIHEELDVELMDKVDVDYIETLVEQPDSAIPSNIGEREHEAVVEIADLILQRIDIKDQ
jgi:hypothetical protein